LWTAAADRVGMEIWGCKDGKIAAIDSSIEAEAARIVDAQGSVLCPGFIDPHSHWDAAHLEGTHAIGKLRQGVVLDLVGNCGESLAPTNRKSAEELLQLFPRAKGWIKPGGFDWYTKALDEISPGLGVMSHVGHATLRIMAMGQKAGPPSPDQMKLMETELEKALDQGAAGLTTGLYYTPSGYAGDEELRNLLKVVAKKGRFHASHIRNEGNLNISALDEVIQPGLETGAATHISHLKMAGRKNWGRADEVIKKLTSARKAGLDLTCDMYPYQRSCTGLLALLPPYTREGGVEALKERLSRPAERERIKAELLGGDDWESTVENAGFEGITISSVYGDQSEMLLGKTLAQAAEEAGKAPADLVLDLVNSHDGAISIICSSMCEKNVAEFIKLPFVMIGSDGSPSQGMGHPRAYGAFPRVIRRFVRELKVLSLEEAIAKMSGMTAARLGFTDRGLLKKGCRADLLVFDPMSFGDRASFEKPKTYPEGLDWVFLEGTPVWTPDGAGEKYPGGFVPAV
jgi:N-acyl-D-amino-acid deacylase